MRGRRGTATAASLRRLWPQSPPRSDVSCALCMLLTAKLLTASSMPVGVHQVQHSTCAGRAGALMASAGSLRGGGQL